MAVMQRNDNIYATVYCCLPDVVGAAADAQPTPVSGRHTTPDVVTQCFTTCANPTASVPTLCIKTRDQLGHGEFLLLLACED